MAPSSRSSLNPFFLCSTGMFLPSAYRPAKCLSDAPFAAGRPAFFASRLMALRL